MVVDKILVRELTLYTENDGTIYRQRTTPLINNYARRKLKGTYSKPLALKGILMIVEAGIKSYRKDFGLGRVSAQDKMAIAKELYPTINETATFEAKRLRKQMMAKKKIKGKKLVRKK